MDELVAFDELLTNRLHSCMLCGKSVVWEGIWLCEDLETGQSAAVAYGLCMRCVAHDPVQKDGMRAGVDALLRRRYGFAVGPGGCALPWGRTAVAAQV